MTPAEAVSREIVLYVFLGVILGTVTVRLIDWVEDQARDAWRKWRAGHWDDGIEDADTGDGSGPIGWVPDVPEDFEDWLAEQSAAKFWLAEAQRITAVRFQRRTHNALTNAGIHTVQQLTQHTPAQLLLLQGFGVGCLRDVQDKLAAAGLTLAETAEEAATT